MPTYEQFLSMDLVDSCKDSFPKDLCDTCWIHNCRRSYLFRASLVFWTEYNENKEVIAIMSKLTPMLNNRPEPKPMKGFKRA